LLQALVAGKAAVLFLELEMQFSGSRPRLMSQVASVVTLRFLQNYWETFSRQSSQLRFQSPLLHARQVVQLLYPL
jgi:hypothetical protein